MFTNQHVDRPQKRSALRKFLGKEYFIVKRQIKWLFAGNNYAQVDNKITFSNSLIKHKSFLLRPLKDVDMYLQHNKVVNLKIAIQKINNVVIKPGQIVSIWRLVGRPTKSKG